MLSTDYLVIGSGAASIAFVDTILTEQPGVKITIVDKHSAPGGHWNDAYGHVRLHQPSLLYGVASEQLEGSWSKLLFSKLTLPWKHRASKTELLAHYKALVDKWVREGRVAFYPNCMYNFEAKPDPASGSNIHTFTNLDGNKRYKIRVNVKLVNGVRGECRVPSKFGLQFPVSSAVTVMTPNQIYDLAKRKDVNKSKNKPRGGNYVVLGNGKTAMDAVVFLQRDMKVKPDNIRWVIPNDVWMLDREGTGMPSSWPEALLEHNLDADKAALALEKSGAFIRLDRKVTPTKFRFASVSKEEIRYMQRVKNIIRRGRVSAIGYVGKRSPSGEGTIVKFTKGQSLKFDSDTVFVHCTSPGPFNGKDETMLFPNDKEINLWLLFAPPVPISMSCIAALESRRQNGTLDVKLGRQLVEARTRNPASSSLSGHEILNELIRGMDIKDDAMGNLMGQVDTLVVTAAIVALLDKDPIAALGWMSGNRLSALSIPGAKSNLYESVCAMINKGKFLNLKTNEIEMLSLLAEKLKPLQGK